MSEADNSTLIDQAGQVRAGEEVDAAKVTAYLQGQGLTLEGSPQVQQFPGGVESGSGLPSLPRC